MAAMARSLAASHEVTVLTSQGRGLAREEIDHDVRVIRVPVLFRGRRAVANFPSMAAYLPAALWRGLRFKRGSFDVVNTHFVLPTGPVGSILSQTLAVPNVLSVHGGDMYDPCKRSSPHRHRLLRASVSHLLRGADAVVAQSRDTARNVREIYGVERAVDLIPLGIERPERGAVPARSTFQISEDAFVLMTTGRVVARKATEQLVQTLVAVAGSVLLVVGEGPEASNVMRKAEAAGVAGRLRMLGYVSEAVKNQAYQIADVFVSTSQHEGFGLVFLEAMAFGLPIVCYDRGGQTDFLSTATSGYVVPLNDLKAFNAAVQALRDSPAARAAMRRNNLSKIENYYIDHCSQQYAVLFERAMERHRTGLPHHG